MFIMYLKAIPASDTSLMKQKKVVTENESGNTYPAIEIDIDGFQCRIYPTLLKKPLVILIFAALFCCVLLVMMIVVLTIIVGVSLLCCYCITSPLCALRAIVSHVVDVTE